MGSQQQFPKLNLDLNNWFDALFPGDFYYVNAVQLFPSLLYMTD